MSMPTFVKAPSAMALGGVPIGVPKPPKLAAIGMASVNAAGAALSFGKFFKTGPGIKPWCLLGLQHCKQILYL